MNLTIRGKLACCYELILWQDFTWRENRIQVIICKKSAIIGLKFKFLLQSKREMPFLWIIGTLINLLNYINSTNSPEVHDWVPYSHDCTIDRIVNFQTYWQSPSKIIFSTYEYNKLHAMFLGSSNQCNPQCWSAKKILIGPDILVDCSILYYRRE